MTSRRIKRNDIVYLNITIEDSVGNLIDSTEGREAFTYLHGRKSLIPKLENTLADANEGQSLTVRVSPEEGFGERDEGLVLEVPLANLPSGCESQLGEVVQMNGPSGFVSFEVCEIDPQEGVAKLDANHPLAGRVLDFHVTVVAIRDAHKDEVKHRRPHHAGHHLMVQDSSWFGEI